MLGGRAGWATVAGTVCVLVASLIRPMPAGAGSATHARLVGSEPADGSVVDQAPDTVTLEVDAKPATVEGDPLRVYGPTGQRIDDGHVTASDDGRRISVGLGASAERPAGHYEIVYRIVSADTHLIAGRLDFDSTQPAPAVAALTGPAGGPARRLLPGWPTQPWPPLVAAGASVLVLYRTLRRPRPPTRDPKAVRHGRVR